MLFRSSGKTQISALIAAFEATFGDVERGRGELYALMIAQDHRASLRAAFAYARAPFESVPVFNALVQDPKAESLALTNGVVMAAYPCRPAAVRGLRSRVVLLDELAYYRSAEGNPQDVEMLRAARPTLATTGGRLIILSSPAGQQGALWDLFERHWGRDGSPVLIIQATAPEMNPTLPADYLARMELDDPEGYRSEVLGEFRAGSTQLFDPEALNACIEHDRRETPPRAGLVYKAFVDASSGRRDAFAVAIGHRHCDVVSIDAIRAWRAPFNPVSATAECAALLRRYGVPKVRGDRFAVEWVAEAFRVNGITYEESSLAASDLYLEMLSPINSAQVRLPDLPDLRQELLGLERRRGSSNRDRVVHPPSRHDDMANAAAGLVHLLHRRKKLLDEYVPLPVETTTEPTPKKCLNCGELHMTTEATPRCPQLGWTARDLLWR